MTKHGFTYKGKKKIDKPMNADLYQYYNAQLGIYFDYCLVSSRSQFQWVPTPRPRQ